MKILHLIYSFQTGGSETMLVDIINEQINQAEISLIIINKKYNIDLVNNIDKRVKVFFIDRKESSRNPFPIIRLNALLLKLKADVLHCHDHNIVPLLFPALKKKTVLTVHDVGIELTYFSQYKKLFAISKTVKDDIQNRSGLTSVLVYNGICLNKITKKETSYISNRFKIIIVSRLSHEKKGQHLVIEALHILKLRGYSNIQLDLIGSGNSEQYLKELTTKYILNEQVNFLGLKDRNYIYSHLKDYDLLIQPSLFEGFGLTIVEGMAARVPVLVSNIDEPFEIIVNGKYGFLFLSGDINDLVKKIILIKDSYNQDIQFLQKVDLAYDHVKKNFDIKLTATKYLENYC